MSCGFNHAGTITIYLWVNIAKIPITMEGYLFLFFSRQVLFFWGVPGSMLFCCAASLLFCFCASVPFYLYYSTFSFLQSCVFAALLPACLPLCFLSLLPLCSFFSFALFSPVCILNETLKTLGETQRNPKEILIRTPEKKPLHDTLKKP